MGGVSRATRRLPRFCTPCGLSDAGVPPSLVRGVFWRRSVHIRSDQQHARIGRIRLREVATRSTCRSATHLAQQPSQLHGLEGRSHAALGLRFSMRRVRAAPGLIGFWPEIGRLSRQPRLKYVPERFRVSVRMSCSVLPLRGVTLRVALASSHCIEPWICCSPIRDGILW